MAVTTSRTRVQLRVDEEDDRWLEELARKLQVSKAVLIREALRLYEIRQTPVEEDPLWQLVGFIDDPDGPTDMAERHDLYLMEWEYRRNHPEG